MVGLKDGRENKFAPLYAGPYVVARKTQADNYVLRDEKETLEVEDIRDHRRIKMALSNIWSNGLVM
ncbi:hypothetical protein INT46_008911, partial [Mucor plumbeus]